MVSGQYDAELYSVHGLTLESRKRREHLSSDDLEKNKALLQHFTKGTYNVYNEVNNVLMYGKITVHLIKNVLERATN